MSSMPEVKIGEWVSIWSTPYSIKGLVMGISSEYISVGYYQNQVKAVKEDVIWKDNQWHFKSSGPDASYLHGAEAEAVKRGPLQIP